MNKVVVTGANGQLGQAIALIAVNYPSLNFVFLNRKQLNITNSSDVHHYFDENKCDFVINCAAYTAVDKAESEQELAKLINADAVQFLAEATSKHQIKLIQISTDYVFDGTQSTPRKENDPTNPINIYGETKLAGEVNTLLYNQQSLVIRTSWVYSRFGNNFVKTMLRLFNEKEEMGIIDDQLGSPTNAIDLAEALIQIVSANKFVPGIMNYSNEGQCSWYQFAVEIKKLTNASVHLNPIQTSAYPTPAKRPAYSLLDKTKIKEIYSLTIPHWEVSLASELIALK